MLDSLPDSTPPATPHMVYPSGRLGATEAVNEPPISRRDLPHPPNVKGGGPLPIGTKLGHFVVERYIGGGGMGRVYLAHDSALDRRVAIKVLPQQWAHDKSTVARFMNEARSAARLNHEHIAQVYFAHEYRGTPYIAFEYVEGTNIRDLVEAYGTFAVPQAINYIIQITHALNHISLHGVVHRDVKPSNILITPQGNAKLIDMGLARLLGPSESQHDLTASGVTLGTFDYISPEQARDPRIADIRSDIYSLGCTLFFMFAGRPPFPEGTVLQKLLQHQGDEPPSLLEFVPNAPPELIHITAKMMAKDPRQRYQTPASLLDSLTHAAELIGLQPVGPGRSVWVTRTATPASRWRFHLPWILPTAALIIAVLVMFILERQAKFLIPDVTSNYPVITTPTISTPTNTEPTNGNIKPLVPLVRSVVSVNGVRLTPVSGGVRWGGAAVSGGGIIRTVSTTTTASQTTSTISTTTISHTLFVDPTAAIPGSYTTLASALIAAESGATIALAAPTGSDKITSTQPLIVADKHLRIVALTPSDTAPAPRLVFQAGDSAARAMLTIQSGSLTFENVILEMEVPTSPAPWWSMIEMSSRGTLRCSHCVLLIRNQSSRHSDVAFVRSTAPTILEPELSNTDIQSAVVALQDTAIQGEAALLKWDTCRPVRVEATNCFIATDSPPFSLEASSRACKYDEVVTADLQFVTVVTKSPFWQQTQMSSAASLLPSCVQASGCIFVFATAAANAVPLFDCYTAIDPIEAANSFRWVSGQQPSFFQGLSAFSRVRTHALGGAVEHRVSLDDWQLRVSFPLRLNQVAWENQLLLDRPIASFRAQDFAMRIDPDTTRDAGVNAVKLLGY